MSFIHFISLKFIKTTQYLIFWNSLGSARREGISIRGKEISNQVRDYKSEQERLQIRAGITNLCRTISTNQKIYPQCPFFELKYLSNNLKSEMEYGKTLYAKTKTPANFEKYLECLYDFL